MGGQVAKEAVEETIVKEGKLGAKSSISEVVGVKPEVKPKVEDEVYHEFETPPDNIEFETPPEEPDLPTSNNNKIAKVKHK